MIKSKSEMPDRGIEIDLSGPEGNAFVLLGYAQRWCRELGYDDFRTKCILEEMKLTDYEGLLHTFDREFAHAISC